MALLCRRQGNIFCCPPTFRLLLLPSWFVRLFRFGLRGSAPRGNPRAARNRTIEPHVHVFTPTKHQSGAPYRAPPAMTSIFEPSFEDDEEIPGQILAVLLPWCLPSTYGCVCCSSSPVFVGGCDISRGRYYIFYNLPLCRAFVISLCSFAIIPRIHPTNPIHRSEQRGGRTPRFIKSCIQSHPPR